MNETLRLFVALDIPSEVKSGLGRLRGELESGLASLRWVRPEGIHLTLSFLGEVPGNRLEALRHALSGCPGPGGAFRLAVEGVGVFPHLRSPRILWAGFHRPPEPLYHLQRRVAAALECLGFPTERRAFRPHLTVGRFRRSLRRTERDVLTAGLARCQERSFGGFTVDRLSLVSSTLLPSGARYDEVEGWALSPPGDRDEVKEQ